MSPTDRLIMQPGIYPDFPTAAYFADPCPRPSFTQSLAKILLEKSPLHAWYAHPRLNPDFRADDDTSFDVGNIAHKLLIGRGRDLSVLEFTDWRTNAAKDARRVAESAGKLAVLGKHVSLADKMVRAARMQLEQRGLGDLFREGAGDGEVVLACREPGTDIWHRQMVDWLTRDHLIFADYKTTDQNAAPHALARKLVADGWDIQGAMGRFLLNRLAGERGRRFFFVVQETAAPYSLSVVELSSSALTMGAKKLAAAMAVWRSCIASNRWPGYPLEIVVPDYPEWAEAQWLERERNEFASTPIADLMMAG